MLIDLIRLESLAEYIRQTPQHKLTYYDITFIISGNGKFNLDGNEFPVVPNQLYFTAPGQIREWKVDQVPQGLVLIFEEEFLCSFFSDPLFVKNLSFFRNQHALPEMLIDAENSSYFTNLLLQIEGEIANTKETHLLRALLYQALAWLNRQYREQNQLDIKPSNHKARLFTQLVENHFQTQHSVSFYASELCITSGYLNDLVKKETGISAKQYIINRLVTEARRLLQYSESSVAEISWTLGFADSSYFIRLFRNETKVSPLAFRKKYLS